MDNQTTSSSPHPQSSCRHLPSGGVLQFVDKENLTINNHREENASFRRGNSFQSLTISKTPHNTPIGSANTTSAFLIKSPHNYQEKIPLTPQRRCFMESGGETTLFGSNNTIDQLQQHNQKIASTEIARNSFTYGGFSRSNSSCSASSSSKQLSRQCSSNASLSMEIQVLQEEQFHQNTSNRTRLDSDPVASILLLKELDEDDMFIRQQPSDDLQELFRPEQRSTLVRPKATKMLQ